ncbi:uncharacterized protein LOC105828253 [Monomorium pharaonis]|uniref:uncharacterized protein LOC105828253 n=1 Tax=Monomorium pharaonis TaxID=307658 RepID=UPI00063EE051|nr:uncharacterized protein LOC105828253 [Monomorium pharaonis]
MCGETEISGGDHKSITATVDQEANNNRITALEAEVNNLLQLAVMKVTEPIGPQGGRASRDRVNRGRASRDQASRDQASWDRASRDRASRDRASRGQASRDRVSQGRATGHNKISNKGRKKL